MTYAELRQSLKNGQIPSLLLLHGEETFFIEEAVRLVCDRVVAVADRDFNLSRFHGRDLKAAEVIDQARTFPMFAPQRLVLIKNIQDAPAEQQEILTAYLDDPVPETVLLVVGEKLDGRKKFFQTFRKRGEVVEFKRIYDNQLPATVKELAASLNVTLTGAALQLFCKRVGTNLVEVHGQLEKLRNFVAPQDLVDVDAVAAVVSDCRAESVFALTDALGEGQRGEALRLLDRLLKDGQAPLMILAMLVRHFRQLWKTRALLDQGVAQKDLPALVKVSPYFLKNLMTQSQRFTPQTFRRIFELFLETDMALKSGGAEAEAHLEQLVLRLGQAAGAASR